MLINNLSIIIPVYNEENTVALILDKVLSVNIMNNIGKEIIIVNDCSTDKTGIEIEKFIRNNPTQNIRYVQHEVNKGKGATLRTGISLATGEYLIIQDADIEYDPNDYNDLLQPVLAGFADVVYGSRFSDKNHHRKLFNWHTVGNKFLTFLSNLFSNLNLTDMETCYKLFNTKIIKSLKLKENRFGFEPEVTLKIARIPGIRVHEIGISYNGRGFNEGKKIGWKDGFRAVYCICKYGLLKA